MKEYTKKEASLLQEKQVANLVNGQVQVASGGLSHNGGDVLTDNWFFECKTVTTPKDSYSVKKSIIDKMDFYLMCISYTHKIMLYTF